MMPSISVHELHKNLETLHLIDVRESWEWDIAHIFGASHIPLGDLLSNIDTLDKDRSTAVICHHGVRSAKAVGILLQHGFSAVYNVTGGIDAWSKEIDPSVPLY